MEVGLLVEPALRTAAAVFVQRSSAASRRSLSADLRYLRHSYEPVRGPEKKSRLAHCNALATNLRRGSPGCNSVTRLSYGKQGHVTAPRCWRDTVAGRSFNP